MEHFSASQILGSPLTADPHEAAHVVVRLSSIPHAGQGPSQKMIELKFTLVKGIVIGCGIARSRGLLYKLENFSPEFDPQGPQMHFRVLRWLVLASKLKSC